MEDNELTADVSRETMLLVDNWFSDNEEKLTVYAEQLLWWNKRLNLVSRSLSNNDALLHIRHSLYAGCMMNQSDKKSWIDTGTGGGLPGIPLAIVFNDLHFVLNDIVGKKIVAVKAIISDLKLDNAEAVASDIGSMKISFNDGIVTKHAFKIPDLLNKIEHTSWSELVMLKGDDYIQEWQATDRKDKKISVGSIDSVEKSPFFEGKKIVRICRTPLTAQADASKS